LQKKIKEIIFYYFKNKIIKKLLKKNIIFFICYKYKKKKENNLNLNKNKNNVYFYHSIFSIYSFSNYSIYYELVLLLLKAIMN
jgi:hypothetical protein